MAYKFKYYLPDKHGKAIEQFTNTNSLIIIGANGSGKSKLGAWMENQDLHAVHRICAQRSLNFKDNIALKNYSEAENFVFYGANFANDDARKNKIQRYHGTEPSTINMLDDFDNVLAALIALRHNEVETFFEACKKSEENGSTRPATPETVLEELQKVWDKILPHRKLKLNDSRFRAVAENGEEYSATQMSDGERSILYLAAQVLCVPENKTLIIDEPEIHLHRSIMNKTWQELELLRPDCLFVYITHDTQFASLHRHADKIWIHGYDGHKWEYDKISENNLPEELLFNILGNRNNVLFVEGTESGYDTVLYSEIFPQFYVIPCGSCTQVISRTKAFRNCPVIHHCKVFGIIDRDFRTDYEIEKYKNEGIFTIDVAEVENLFLTEEVLRVVARHLAKNDDEVFDKIKKYVIDERFSAEMERQVCQSTVSRLKYQLSCIELSGKNNSDVRKSLEDGISGLDYDSIFKAERDRFKSVLDSKDYHGVLRVFNSKSLLASIGNFLGIINKEYPDLVLSLFRGVLHDNLMEAFSKYMPSELAL